MSELYFLYYIVILKFSSLNRIISIGCLDIPKKTVKDKEKETNAGVLFKNTEEPDIIDSILVGLILGDSWLEKQKINARLRFEQSHLRTEFFFDVFKFISIYSPNLPKLRERFDKRTQKIYQTWHFSTLSLPYFTKYFDLFYVNNKKCIPSNIENRLNSRALAYWIMCDGYKYNRGVALATNNFSLTDNELLINALNKNFNFNFKLINDHGQPTIYIPFENVTNLQILVIPFMHSSLLYKIHL